MTDLLVEKKLGRYYLEKCCDLNQESRQVYSLFLYWGSLRTQFPGRGPVEKLFTC